MSEKKTGNIDKKPWHILGAGSIGGLFAAHMSANGADCRLLLKDEQMAAWKINPSIRIQFGNLSFTQNITTEKLNTATLIDRLIITTKAQDTLKALQSISHRVMSNAAIILLQNGMGVAEQIREKFPHVILLQASTSEGVYRPAIKEQPFSLIHAGRSKTLIGSSTNPELAAQFAEACGPILDVQLVPNIDEYLWRKLAVNAVINPLTALNDCNNGDLAKLPLRIAANQLCDELELFAAHSVQKDALKNIRKDVFNVINDTANNCSSMRADIRAGRKTEIDYITGFLCDEAKKIGVSLPRHAALLELIRLKEADKDIIEATL